MDKEEADFKLRLIEVLLIVAGILVGMKQGFSELSISIFIALFMFSIIYYIQVSDYKNKNSLSRVVIFLVAIFFSAALGTAMKINQGNLFGIAALILFTILLYIALNERSYIKQKGNQLKKFISKISQFNPMKKKAVKRNIPTSDALAGLGIGVAYIFFGIQEIGNPLVKTISGIAALFSGSILTLVLIYYLLSKQLRHKKRDQ